ncbi:hypothetical protein CBS101457_005325 [Exobasidium rhododendri]|nr:hypothetical protein CBS101457_005325 [Exobasidium rhododendri]
MTAAGSSATDTLSSLYDQATSLLGFGSGQAQSNDGGDGKETEQGAIDGPGNHPSSNKALKQDNQGRDHEHSEYKAKAQYEEDTETNIDEAGASAGNTLPKDGNRNPVDDGERGQRKTQSGAPADALERALGDEGPTGNLTGAKIGRELENDTYAKKVAKRNEENNQGINESTSTAAAGAAVGEPMQSERNKPEEVSSIAKRRASSDGGEDGYDSEKDEDKRESAKKALTEQHPHQKGPMWASRPDDEQREKLKQAADEKRKRDKAAKDASGYNTVTGWVKLKMGSSKAMAEGDGGVMDDQGQGENKAQIQGLDLLRDPKEHESGSKKEETSTDAPSTKQRKSQNRMSSLFSGGGSSGQKEGQKKESTLPVEHDSKYDGETDGARPKSSSRSNSQAPQDQKERMSRISKMMIGGGGGQSGQAPKTSTSARSEDGQGDESEQRGLDGVQLSGASNANARWGALRKRLRENAAKRAKGGEEKTRVIGQMSVITELQTGILPVFMLKMSLERDEGGNRRIPVLLNHLRLRISDSVNVLHSSSAIFRIELEYGDGLVRWVCYRSLRDFINLHTHYRAAAIKGYLGRPVGQGEGDIGIPSFPKTSLPYFNQLKREGRTKGNDNVKAEFAKAQRDALEDYIVELIKRTMFRPEANRLCKFFELSALSISLATRGGFQGKQGYLRILSKSSRKDAQKGILTPINWAKSHDPKWFIVRESYIVIVDEPDSLQVHDVFLLDGSFEIERPKRLYKQTMHLAHEFGISKEKGGPWENQHLSKEEREFKSKKNEQGNKSATMSKAKESNAAKQREQRKWASDPSGGKDTTAILTDGQFHDEDEDENETGQKKKRSKDDPNANVSSHTFYIKNAERKLKVVAKNERQMDQFIASMERVARRNVFSKSNRFGSFAPIRLNCSAQWLVDGRDYFWQVSRALMRAKDRIMIHDWWLSPELYLRRPGTPKYRLDNILQKKAEEGVKIFVIVYNEVSNNFTPTDSNYTKQRLTGLHRNIFVQRSPSHFQTGTFYWAHHEKMCVIDETIAFMGGLDLCFGRWDTPTHLLTDNHVNQISQEDKGSMPSHDETLLGPGVNGKEFYIWPGQDFANERVVEWSDLTKPENDLFDREKSPRMPWHDISLQLIGQPARDLCRHFSQRWNYLLRIKNHKRLMPFLVPPPDFQPHELMKYDLTGTCEAQICRSAGPWSLGTPTTVEHSIQNAYLKAIQMSEHFVYIENQFFITSTVTRGTVITNQIGEALVSRIIRAHREQAPWKAVIVIPLVPGFPMPIDHQEAASVRLIVELQMSSICRTENSIFGKLRSQGIDPDDYITFFSLRQWGKLPSGQLTTEQVYIHAKAMVVDDRLALIGSANINERSQRGDRDSELACVIRDTDMIDSTMGGKPFKVGRFAHTLRIRLMKEHLGLDVDEVDQEAADLQDVRPEKMLDEDDQWDPSNEQSKQDADGDTARTNVHQRTPLRNFGKTFKEFAGPASEGAGKEAKEMIHKKNPLNQTKFGNGTGEKGQEEVKQDSSEQHAQPTDERIKRIVDLKQGENKGSEDTVVPTIEERLMADGTIPVNGKESNEHQDATNEEVKKSMSSKMSINPWAAPSHPPTIDPDMFNDPLDDRFYKEMWMASAVHNTQIYRKVFKSVPDDTVTTWSEYKAFMAWADRLAKSGGAQQGNGTTNTSKSKKADEPSRTQINNRSNGNAPHSNDDEKLSKTATVEDDDSGKAAPEAEAQSGLTGPNTSPNANPPQAGAHSNTNPKSIPRPPPSVDEGFSKNELEQMERLLEETRGTLVLHCTRFLEAEDRSDNFLFPLDKINPLNVYD